ncbi:MAG TPA: hypothetical protein VI298_04895 [Geobacteraceae bacterium]
MKKTMLLAGILPLWLCSTAAYAFVSGSTGSLGAFNPTADTVVTLPPDGILNYTTVNIPTGVTVTFAKNAVNTPVYMLATGDVTIAGTISVNGVDGTSSIPGKGGPGGFDGGYSGMWGGGIPGGKGLGPGGGDTGQNGGAGGGFGEPGSSYNGANGGSAYGNSRCLPLIGGSGGAGRNDGGGGNGGGGGGAIVIATSTSITVTGTIMASGGSGSPRPSYWETSGGGGSGGSIKLVAGAQLTGNGSIYANGGWGDNAGAGGRGRIRFEAPSNNFTTPTNPPYSYGLPASVFIPNAPTLTITSIGGTAPPASPTGNYIQPDMLLPNTTTNPVPVNVSATNIPDGTTVTVWVLPQYGSATSVNSILSSSTATANVTLSTTYSNVITAQATFTVVGMYYNGEEIDKVRVATKLGGGSETTYITRAGKEIKGELVAALMK